MLKPQIIGIGLNGLVGSRIKEILIDEFDFISLGLSKGVDITKPDTLATIKDYPNADFILHLAAKTDVDSCQKDKDLKELGEAWKVNVQGAESIAKIAQELGKKVIYISTDFVFDGEKLKGEKYDETDSPSPINWYGLTKYEGEQAVEKSGADFLILRLAYPFRADFESKKDFVRFIKDRFEKGIETKIVTDHIFCPTFLDDFAHALKTLIKNDATGTFHTTGEECLSPLDAALIITKVFNLDENLILKTTREEFFKDRAPRPFNLALSNAKIEKLGVKMKGFEESLQAIKSQLQ